MGRLLNELAFEYDGDFQWIQKRMQGLQEISYKEFIEQARRMLGRKNKERLGILLNGELPKNRRFSYTRAPKSKPNTQSQ